MPKSDFGGKREGLESVKKFLTAPNPVVSTRNCIQAGMISVYEKSWVLHRRSFNPEFQLISTKNPSLPHKEDPCYSAVGLHRVRTLSTRWSEDEGIVLRFNKKGNDIKIKSVAMSPKYDCKRLNSIKGWKILKMIR